MAWAAAYHDFYSATQTSGLGGYVTKLGYQPIKQLYLDGKAILEIGPGSLPHRDLWQGKPGLFISVDVDPEFHILAEKKSQSSFQAVTRKREDTALPLPDETVDIILTFYSLEHITNLEENVKEFRRVLRPGGKFVGAVPNEGGLAWGLARFFSTRKWIQKHYGLDYDKIISWEHPNYVDDIQVTLDNYFLREKWTNHPFRFSRSLNINLISSFVYRKAS